MKRILSLFVGFAILLSPLAFSVTALATTSTWDTSGDYTVEIMYLGTDYSRNISLTQYETGDITGSGSIPV
jgi:hypothetical protein